MSTYGDTAISVDMAKLVPGNIVIKPGERLGIQQAIWRQGIKSGDGMYIDRLILVAAEEYEGQWEIGVPNGQKYRAAKAKV